MRLAESFCWAALHASSIRGPHAGDDGMLIGLSCFPGVASIVADLNFREILRYMLKEFMSILWKF